MPSGLRRLATGCLVMIAIAGCRVGPFVLAESGPAPPKVVVEKAPPKPAPDPDTPIKTTDSIIYPQSKKFAKAPPPSPLGAVDVTVPPSALPAGEAAMTGQPSAQPVPPPKPLAAQPSQSVNSEPEKTIVDASVPQPRAAVVTALTHVAAAAPGRFSNPAIATLHRKAMGAISRGELNEADLLYEQALRIEPRNGWLLHALAEVRIALKKPQSARGLIARSHAVAGDDVELVEANQTLLASLLR